MNKLSAAIITKNEEKNIKRCLESVRWADEIIVVDSGSTDKTVGICKSYDCRIELSEWLGFAKTKQKAVDLCTNDWVLVLDADEEITDSLKDRLLKILDNPVHSGYRIKRESFYLGKKIRYCGWDKDYTLRLFDKNKGRFNNKAVHESVQIQSGTIGVISDPMIHYTYPTISSHIDKMNTYSDLGAAEMAKKGHASNPVSAVLRGLAKFVKMYILKLGFLDGKTGFVLCVNSAYGVYLKYLKMWKKGIEYNK
ncbi:MAG: glycosyltransferase family 2 protein [Candidatus Delongbacteria bacterium]|jgi:glycosyltransferase involved in cell wall biosynthesis